MVSELRFVHIDRPGSPNLSHHDTRSLASTTSTTLYHADSVEDADTQMGLKCNSCKFHCPIQIYTAKPSQPPASLSVLR